MTTLLFEDLLVVKPNSQELVEPDSPLKLTLLPPMLYMAMHMIGSECWCFPFQAFIFSSGGHNLS